jgi:hypothetical protein
MRCSRADDSALRVAARGRTAPVSNENRPSSVARFTPSFLKSCLQCDETVSSETERRSATWARESPRCRSSAISRSRRVSDFGASSRPARAMARAELVWIFTIGPTFIAPRIGATLRKSAWAPKARSAGYAGSLIRSMISSRQRIAEMTRRMSSSKPAFDVLNSVAKL